MIGRDRILALIPHQGAMCLLDEAVLWTAERIVCRAVSHLDPANPLRRAGGLHTLCGAEYALQAAALHGALLADETPQPAGYLVALRGVELGAARLDDPAHGTLQVEAVLDAQEASGLIYALRVRARDGRVLLAARGTVALPGRGAAAPGRHADPLGPGGGAHADAPGRGTASPRRHADPLGPGGDAHADAPGRDVASPGREADPLGPDAAPRTPPA